MYSWLLEKYPCDENFNGNLIEALNQSNTPYKIYDYDPFKKEKWDNLFPEESKVITYGSIQLVNKIRRETNWNPGIFYTPENYKCSYYYPYFDDYLLNNQYIMMSLGNIHRNQDFLFQAFNSDHLFIRPNEGNKIFTGQVIPKDNWKGHWAELIRDYAVPTSEICLISNVLPIQKEWRFLIIDNKPVTSCEYFPEELLGEAPTEVWDFVGKVLNEVNFEPDPAWVMDICQFEDGYKVLEIGAFSVAGLYGCDAVKVVGAINKILKEYEEIK